MPDALEESLQREAQTRKWTHVFVFVNTVLLILSISLICLIISLGSYWDFFEPFLNIYSEFHGMGVIFGGSTMCICVFFGYCIVCTKRSSHYIWYGLSLMLVMIIDSKIIMSGLLNERNIQIYVEKMFSANIAKYSNDTAIKRSIDNTQLALMCCGVNNYTDWLDAGISIPYSCCPFASPTNPQVDGACTNITHSSFFSDPCLPKLVNVPALGMILIYCIVGCLMSLKILSMILAYKMEQLYKYL